METLVADARGKGARVVTGGSRIGNRGYFYPLTVLADVPDDARAMHEEPFGPLALLSPVRSLDEAIEKANSVPYGLAAYAFTHSARNVDRMAERVEVGNLSINHFWPPRSPRPRSAASRTAATAARAAPRGSQCYTVREERLPPHDMMPDTTCRSRSSYSGPRHPPAHDS